MTAVSASASNCARASLIDVTSTVGPSFCDDATPQTNSLFEHRESDLSEIGVESESEASVGPIELPPSVDVSGTTISIDTFQEPPRFIPKGLYFQLLKPPQVLVAVEFLGFK